MSLNTQISLTSHNQKLPLGKPTESYTLLERWRVEALRQLGVSPEEVAIDLFSDERQPVYPYRCHKKNSAFDYSWTELSQHSVLWANPPFSILTQVLEKLLTEESVVLVLLIPDWKSHAWYEPLCQLAIRSFTLPRKFPLYVCRGNKVMPSPRKWQSKVLYINFQKTEDRRQKTEDEVFLTRRFGTS